MSERFLVLQSSYKVLSIGLSENEKIVDRFIESKLTPSSSLVPHAIKLLSRNNLTIHNMKALIVDQGPGAFGSLRVLLSTANALGFAIKIPIVGVDGLSALAFDVVTNYESFYSTDDESTLLVTMLNAYNVECYYGIYDVNLKTHTITTTFDRGYAKVYTLMDMLNEHYPNKNILFVGNAIPLYNAMIQEKIGSRATCIEDRFDLASIDTIAHYGFEQWHQNPEPTYKLLPLYLKNQLYALAPK